MIRTSFEFKLVANSLETAESLAKKSISKFLQIDESKVNDFVAMELKVSYQEEKTIPEITEAANSDEFVVTVYAAVKQGITGAFGF